MMRRRRRNEPTRGSTGWIARTLSDQGMPPSEVRAVLEAEDHLIVRRYVKLHRERLDERLADQVRELEALERMLVGRLPGRGWSGSSDAPELGRVAPIAPWRGSDGGPSFSGGRGGAA